MCYIGVHATALKTIAMIVNSKRDILNVVQGNPIHLREYSFDENYTALNELLIELTKGSGHPPISELTCKHICISCSSVRSDLDRLEIIKILIALGFQSIPNIITGDGAVALAGGSLVDEGIAITVGSGSTVYGIDSSDNEFLVGGWSTLIGEDPGGYEIARRALTSIIRAYDGRGIECNILRNLVLERCGVKSIEELVSMLVTVRSVGYSAKIAEIVLAVIKAAEVMNDSVAQDILDDICEELFNGFCVVRKKLQWQAKPIKVVLEGGIIENSLYLRNKLEKVIQQSSNDTEIGLAIFRPVVGATLFALSDNLKVPKLPKNPLLIKVSIAEFLQRQSDLMMPFYRNLLLAPGSDNI
jgi:N-acetylglucosamine kinase-like BadF-type ATPase